MRLIKLILLFMLSLFIISACSDDSENTETIDIKDNISNDAEDSDDDSDTDTDTDTDSDSVTDYDMSEYTIAIDTEVVTLKTGNLESLATYTLTPTFTAKDYYGDNIDYSVTYESDDSNIATVTKNDDNTATITAIATGETNIAINLIISNETMVTATINISVTNAYTEDAFSDDVKSAFVEEFTTHFVAGTDATNTITAEEGSNAYTNIVFILTTLANQEVKGKAVGLISNNYLAGAFGRIVAEEVSDSEACNEENLTLGCALLTDIPGDTSTFKGTLNEYLSNTDDYEAYISTFAGITENLANLNSQSENIEDLADELEELVNNYGYDEETYRQKIINQLFYATDYMSYITLQHYCKNNTEGKTCEGTSTDDFIDITNISDGTLRMVDGTSSSGYFYYKNYTLVKDAISDVDNLFNENSLSWTVSNSDYSSYVTLYNSAGDEFLNPCNGLLYYIILHHNFYENSLTCGFTKETCTDSVNCAYRIITRISGYVIDSMKNILNDYSYNSNIYRTIFYLQSVAVYNSTLFYNSTSSYAKTFMNRFSDFHHNGYSSYKALDIEPINTVGKKNIYYFITKFINELENGDESYLYGYQFKGSYTSKMLPNDKYYCYEELSLSFMAQINGTAVSLDILNTDSTASFTNDTITSILDNTKTYVVDTLEYCNLVK